MTVAREIAFAMREKSRTLGKTHALFAGMSESEWLPLAEAALAALGIDQPYLRKVVDRDPTEEQVREGVMFAMFNGLGHEPAVIAELWAVMFDQAKPATA